GSTRAGTSIGDGAAEARKRGMGTEINVASVDYLGDQWTFLDVPGSIEFQHDAFAALAVSDAAVLVCEPSPERVVSLTPLLQLIEDIAPEKSLIYRDLHDEFGADQISPVLLGAGDRENGVRRLLKALRHDTPTVAETAKRRALPSNGVAMAECFKVLHQSHAGKL